MLLQFTKNVHFTRLIKIAQKLRELNFRKVPDAADQLFHIDVADDRGNRIVFKVRKDEGRWHIVNNEVPQWIAACEGTLHEVITEEGY
jgi:hypothetical protein